MAPSYIISAAAVFTCRQSSIDAVGAGRRFHSSDGEEQIIETYQYYTMNSRPYEHDLIKMKRAGEEINKFWARVA